MQFYGLDENRPVFVSNASKGKEYFCPECLGALHVRGGPHRQIHFYHLRETPSCRQHQKGLLHIQVQRRLEETLPGSILEKSFPEIGRIADVALEREKLVFEVQCSPISLEEVQQRSDDYRKIGYTPIWILHDRRYNRRKMSAGEHFLRQGCCFFTNIDEKRQGIIYDQREVFRHCRRIFRGPSLVVTPAQLCLGQRLAQTEQVVPIESQKTGHFVLHQIFYAYRSLLHFLLESTAKH